MTRRRQRVRRRRGQRPVRRRFTQRMAGLLRGLLWGATVLAVAGGAGAGAYKAWEFANHSEFFRLHQITVEGVSPAIEREMRALMEDQMDGTRTLFNVSPRLIRARLAEHPRLVPAEIRVRRQWPDALAVTAVERQPVATVVASRLMLVDLDGWVIEQSPAAVAAADLPLLSGLDLSGIIYGQRIDDPYAQSLLRWLAALRRHLPRLVRHDLAELHSEPTGEVTAHLVGGTVIRLGDRPPEEQMPVLLAFTREIESDLTELVLLDLRMSDHLVYRRPGLALPAESTAPPAALAAAH